MDWKRLEEIEARAAGWAHLGHERIEARVSGAMFDGQPKHAVLDSRDTLWLCEQLRASAVDAYLIRWRLVELLSDVGRNESLQANELREEMDAIWNQLSPNDRSGILGLTSKVSNEHPVS